MPRTRTKTHPGSIAKRGPATWRIRLCVGGQYTSFTAKGTKTDAQNFATAKYAELTKNETRARAGLPGPVRLSELVREFETGELPTLAEGTAISYRHSFTAFAAYFGDVLGDPLVRDIRRGHVAGFLEWRRLHRLGDESGDAGVSLFTVARDRRVLHRLFNYGIMKDHLDANPAAMVRAPKADPRTPPRITDAQLDALLDATPSPMLRVLFLTLAETGGRAYSEVARLEWADLDFAGGFVHFRSAPGRRTKSGKSRAVPMTPRLKTALAEHAAAYRMAVYDGQRSPYVFHRLTDGRTAKGGERITRFREAFERAATAAELPEGFRPHDLRHRRVTTWLAAGKNPVHVKEAMGHATLATTMGYTHLLPEHLRALVEEQVGAPAETAKSG